MTAVFKFLFLSVLLTSSVSLARIDVRVGAYDFPPYFKTNNGKAAGLTVQAVRILNSLQRDYRFEIQSMPAEQRYSFYDKKRVDIILFEDPAWAWHRFKYEFLPLDVEDGEVYITAKDVTPPRKFEELKKMRIGVVKGFHYGFAGLDSDERFLKKNFKIEIADNSAGSLHLVLNKRVDVTVLAKSYIYEYLKHNPELRDKVTISDNYDSIYKLGAIFNPSGKIPRTKLESYLEQLKKNPEFIKLIDDRFHLEGMN